MPLMVPRTTRPLRTAETQLHLYACLMCSSVFTYELLCMWSAQYADTIIEANDATKPTARLAKIVGLCIASDLMLLLANENSM